MKSSSVISDLIIINYWEICYFCKLKMEIILKNDASFDFNPFGLWRFIIMLEEKCLTFGPN